MTLKTGVMILKIQLCIIGIQENVLIMNLYIYIYIICSLGALKGLLSKKFPNVLMVMCVY